MLLSAKSPTKKPPEGGLIEDFVNNKSFKKKVLTIRIIGIIILLRGEDMKRTELERKLRKGGYEIKPGGKHNKAVHPDNPKYEIPVPRGSKVNEITARQILKDAGLL